MTTWVLGDVHGCFQTLQALLPRLGLGREDRLWLVGDLANRGPGAVEALRWARETEAAMGDRFRCVLGNHDLHLLRRAEGLRPAKPRDTLDAVLEAPDGAELVDWVAGLPLLHRERVAMAAEGNGTGTAGTSRTTVPSTTTGTSGAAGTSRTGGSAVELLLVHAGLWPEWTPEEAERGAREAEALLRDPATRRRVLDLEGIEAEPPDTETRRRIFGSREDEGGARDQASRTDDTSDGAGGDGRNGGKGAGRGAGPDLAAARLALYALTELRTLRPDGSPDDDFSDHPDDAPPDRTPWYRWPDRASRDALVAFGHWSSLGLYRGDGVLALDTGAIWGDGLTAVRLEDGKRVFQPTVEPPSALPSREG